MKYALCQYKILWEDKEKNLLQAKKFIEQAKEKSGDMIFFPEMSFTGFSMNIEGTQESDFESLSIIKEYAVKYGIAIGFGWVKASDTGFKAQNHYTIVDSGGEVILDYIKMHPFSYALEDNYFISGDNLAYCVYKQTAMSVFICYDLRFPEIFQAVSDRVSHIFIPANWPAQRDTQWMALAKARAIENQVYINGINCVGEMDDKYYNGSSFIIDPNGKIVEQLLNKEGLIFGDTDNLVELVRKEFPVKQDRRNKLYADLLWNSRFFVE